VQRINNVRITSEKENDGKGRPIADGEIVTACEQACPSEAIVSATRMTRTAAFRNCGAPVQPRAYNMLGETERAPAHHVFGRRTQLES